MQVIQVETSSRHYPIYVGVGDEVFAGLESALTGKQILVVTNTTIAPLYLDGVLSRLAQDGRNVQSCILPDGEQYKTMDTVNQIIDCLMAHRFNRNCTLIALGGGVIGDMVGFASAIYQRGVNFVQIPTTLLSQVDSSVGGKTGVNHPMGKNMIGAFKQPSAVFIDTNMLDTLPDREYSAGVAEVIKYGLIRDLPFLQWLEASMTALMAREPATVAEAIIRSCQNKAEVVGRDELESGERALLNLGHTFGHAIETHMGYGVYLHGEAVAIGMLMATYQSYLMKQVSFDDVIRVKHILVNAKLPVAVPLDMSESDFLAVMAHDKKNLSGNIRLILLQSIGRAYLTDDYDHEALSQTLKLDVNALHKVN